MNEHHKDAAARQMAVVRQAEESAAARRRYVLDEEAYALAEQFFLTGGKTVFPQLPANNHLLSSFNVQDRTFFVCRLFAHLQARGEGFDASGFLLPEEHAATGDHIVYVRNYYTEHAYDLFAASLAAPTVSYSSDFTDACAAVGEGLADLCILPFRDELWVPFHSFSRMPEHYGLTVCAVCTVERPDGDTMRLSLCGRGCRIPRNAKKVAVELLFSSYDGEDFETVWQLTRDLGGKIVFAEALPDRYTSATAWRVTCALDGESLAPLLLSRRLFAPDSELLGIYEMPSLSDREV